MAYPPYYLEAVAGNVLSQGKVIHKFGRNPAITPAFSVISPDAVYRTPPPSGAVQLRIKSGGASADTTGTGAGAWSVELQGLDANGDEIREVVQTKGINESLPTVKYFMRLFRAKVVNTGTQSASAGMIVAGASGDIVIENAAGTEDWLTMPYNGFARSQSELAFYTVPRGKAAYLLDVGWSSDTNNKVVEVMFVARDKILDEAAPYCPVRTFLPLSNINNAEFHSPNAPLGVIPELTDVGLIARIDIGTTEMYGNFSILVRDN